MRRWPVRLLCATDFSRASEPALARAVALARRSRAELTLFHVVVPPSPFMDAERSPTWEDLEASARRHAKQTLGRLVARVRSRGARARARLGFGLAAEEIITAARRLRTDLIVMGTHGRTGFRRFFLGSVTERVLALAACPVLTVRAETRRRAPEASR